MKMRIWWLSKCGSLVFKLLEMMDYDDDAVGWSSHLLAGGRFGYQALEKSSSLCFYFR